MALVMSAAPWMSNPFGPAMVLLLMVPVLIMFAPQPIRRDKRTVAVLVTLAAIVVGVPVYAVICNICSVCLGEWWFLFVECWFI